jgi:hypothetical protein
VGTKKKQFLSGNSGSGLFVNKNGRFYVVGIASEIDTDPDATMTFRTYTFKPVFAEEVKELNTGAIF